MSFLTLTQHAMPTNINSFQMQTSSALSAACRKSTLLFVLALVSLLVFTSPGAAKYDLDAIDSLVVDVRPAVVRIEVRKSYQHSRNPRNINPRDLFERFFGPRDFPGFPERQIEPENDQDEDTPEGEVCGDNDNRCRHGEGSGMVISSNGYILTAHHVVDQADRILVWFFDGTVVPAELIGSDTKSDVALLKVDLEGLETVEFGDNDNLKVGEWVVAIGTPFSRDFSVSTGVVSGLNRTLSVDRGIYVPFIQTDTAINPGSSGGPLFDLNGKVVGMNAIILSRSGGYEGVGFAVPVNLAAEVVRRIRETGEYTYGWLGVSYRALSYELMQSLGLTRAVGAIIQDVVEDGPAEQAGLLVGDIVLSVEGKELRQASELPQLVGSIAPGTKVNFVILRDGDRRRIQVTIGALEDSDSEEALPDEDVTSVPQADMALKEVDGGIEVESVGNGIGRLLRLNKGDIITHFNNNKMTTIAELEDTLSSLRSGQYVSARVLRGNGSLIVTTRVP